MGSRVEGRQGEIATAVRARFAYGSLGRTPLRVIILQPLKGGGCNLHF